MKRTLSTSAHKHTSILRIAPVCNGKIYVVPHEPVQGGNSTTDIPIEEYVSQPPTSSGKTAQKVKEKYHLHIHSDMQPRFCVKYKAPNNEQEIVFLYILPLKDESEINFHKGKFISTEEINQDGNRYSSNLQKESELLGMAAELWKEYFQNV